MMPLLRMFLYKLSMLNQVTEVQRAKLYLYLAQWKTITVLRFWISMDVACFRYLATNKKQNTNSLQTRVEQNQNVFNLILPRNLIFGSEQVLRFCKK